MKVIDKIKKLKKARSKLQRELGKAQARVDHLDSEAKRLGYWIENPKFSIYIKQDKSGFYFYVNEKGRDEFRNASFILKGKGLLMLEKGCWGEKSNKEMMAAIKDFLNKEYPITSSDYP
jgi:hypothetical protein